MGCSGRVLLRCLAGGADRVIGVDLSDEAVRWARARARRPGVEDRMTLLTGGVEQLASIRQAIDGAILFNIIDNLLPQDAQSAANILAKKTKAGGRVLLQMSDYFSLTRLEAEGARTIEPNSYRERTGLFFLNLTDREVDSLFDAFKVDLKVRIRSRPGRFWHRLWRLQRT